MLPATWKKNDRKATILIVLVSVIVFAIISILGRVTLNVNLGFDPHIFAKANAVINSVVAVLLLCGLNCGQSKALSLTQANNAYGNGTLHSLPNKLYLPSFVCR